MSGMICHNCGQMIKPGQAFLPERHRHVACPSRRQIERDQLWARARAILESKLR